MKQRYRYRIYPNEGQVIRLAQMFGCSRVVWNDALAECQRLYRQREKYPGFAVLAKQMITEAKRTVERSWLADVSVVPLQQSVRALDVAFRNFFNSVTGKRKGPKVRHPRFKSRKSAQSAEFTQRGFKVGSKLYLAKIGSIKVQWSRKLPSEPSTVTVTRDASGRYFASFVVDVEPELLPWNDKAIGIDLGISTFATLDNGTKVEAPKPLKRSLKKLARLQKALSRCEKSSNRRAKAKLKVAKLHARIKDVRTDFLHKLSTRLIRENQSISIEDLNVSGMVKNRSLAKAISDLGWRQFRTMLEAKAEMYGRDIAVINRWEPTSQTCSCCGHRAGRKKLSIREWQCLNCGSLHDRDVNAAKNIRVAGGQSETINERRRTGKTSLLAQSVDAFSQPCEVQLTLRF
ncbi:RNA-guided endonuclease TnpB family protein [cf. Phormidesmis sp. LEGE 11477]|uniref:RNA-guided endonuclease InsQ/TnpB family protein n=1 Tax=cf. Phormidesmis sp. LEGE 11477 TaxID=1828680 RepID=UPI001881EF9D|nr:RNA-guided endonuclease TnpB family protein [cf. Phormidesmis sp. LEGE 11477]MBE9064733.1 transposase [cf. Phormidesmis sp. LEGE 11477]